MKYNYNIEVVNVLKKAEAIKKELGHEYVGTEHLLLAILDSQDKCVTILNNFGLNYENFKNEIINIIPKVNNSSLDNTYTPLLKHVLLTSMKEEAVTIKSLLFHLIDEGEGVAIRLLTYMDIDVDQLYNLLKNNTDDNLNIYKYGKDLNNIVNIEDKLIGRDKELDLIIQTLLRKKKNNPLLIGAAGVGKSAIVEELARRIVTCNVPDYLSNMHIVMLEMSNLISGTRYRGEFEERLMNIIKELESNPNIILFIDEIHTMVNAGGAEGAIAAGDILKPYLARGDIKCIGATTTEEYEKYLANDKALSRRFENIFIKEPDLDETFNILNKSKEEYEKFYKIKINEEEIRLIISLADIYFPHKKNPDKSIEILDSVMSYANLKSKNTAIKSSIEELHKYEIEKISNIEKGNFKEALINNKNSVKIKKKINLLQNGFNIKISKDDILDVLEFKNNLIIDKSKILNCNNGNELKIINKIKKYIINQKSNITFAFNNIGINDIKKLAKQIHYETIILNKDNINELYKKIKYYPSLIIIVENINDFIIKNLINKIRKEGIIKYNDEYYSFNNTITFILNYQKNIGFETSAIYDIPLDEYIIMN